MPRRCCAASRKRLRDWWVRRWSRRRWSGSSRTGLLGLSLRVGRTPWSARDALVPHLEQRHQHPARRERPTGASAADPGVCPTSLGRVFMDVRRILRVSEAVKEELYEIIGFELEDPRLLEVEVTDVQVSPDSRHAAIKVALRGDQRRRNHALAALEHASGYLRQELASRLQLRHVPELHFEQDKNPDVESRVDFLLRRARKSRGRDEN